MQKLRPCTQCHLFRKLTALIVLALIVPAAAADEKHLEFVEGLRQRKYFDTALEYLDQLSRRTDLPADIAQTLELEKGMTYRALGAASRVPEDREQALNQAEISLKAFVAAHAAHPRAAFANAELGQLLFDRARTLIWDAESPSNAERKIDLQAAARALIDEARAIYQAAHDQYKQQYDQYPKFVDEAKEPDVYRQRQQAQVRYLRAWFNLARCTYERGQTFDKGTKLRKDTLIAASEEFEAIHGDYRTNPVGLQARLMMGKCFQEQDDTRRALGIYNEMLDHKSTNETALILKSLALQYRLICLNQDDRADYQLVIQESDTWLKDKINRPRLYTEFGLGILWEKAIAEENLGKDRTLPEEQKRVILRQALADSRKVAKWPSPYREPALAMGRRINAELGEKDAEPKDFDTAFERARGMVGQLKGLEQDLKEATGPDREKAQQAIELHLNEIGRLFQLALDLREDDTDPKALAQTRYLLSFIYMRQRKSFDAFILARYCMTRDKQNDPDSALSATEIAIEAAVQAFNDAGSDAAFELQLLKGVCELIISQYPSSAKGNEARMRLGQVYRDLDEPARAADAYMSVPREFSQYASARMQAGQSYWLAWASTMGQIERGEEAELDSQAIEQWKTDAEKQLLAGLKIAGESQGKEPPTIEMVAAEVTLASIQNLNGDFAKTIARLTAGGANSAVNAVKLADGEDRPAKGIKSAAFAGQLHRLLLRAYVGTQQIEPALNTMNELKAIGGQDTAEIYTQLGRELQEELERLKASGDDEAFTATQVSFEKFLEQVNAQRDPADYNSLLWIGETYFGLGQGVKDDAGAALPYFEKASAAYSNILDNDLATGTSVLAIRLRQVRCFRAMGRYQEAVDLASTILEQSPSSLDVQFEAAYALADWGADPAGDPAKLLESMNGVEPAEGQKKIIWGWSGITTRLTRQQSTPEWATLEEKFLEARFEQTNSRYRYAATGRSDATAQLQSAQGELTSFAMVYPAMSDTWYARFNGLYRNIQADLGKEATDLPRPEPVEFEPTFAKPETEIAAEEKPKPEPEATVPPPEGPNYLLVSLALALAAGGGFAAYKLLAKPPRQKRRFEPAGGSVQPPPDVGLPGGDLPDGDVPDFSNLMAGTATAAPPRRRRKKAAAAAPEVAPSAPAADGDKPKRAVKKKRVVSPEEAARIKAARAAKAKAAGSAAGAEGDPASEARRKAAKQQQDGGPQAAPKKKVRKRPRPPEE